MQRSTHKFIASLLAFLLAIAPLQSVLAEVSMSSNADATHAMVMDHDEQMDASSASDPCEMADCCNGESCVLGHCVTCFVALYSASYNFTIPIHEAYSLQFKVPFPQQAVDSLYRPPIA